MYTISAEHNEQAKKLATATGLNFPTILQLLQEFGPVVLQILARLFPNIITPTPAPTPAQIPSDKTAP